MHSQMLLNVDYKLSHVIPLTDEEAIWLRKRLDKLYEQMEGVQEGEIISITPLDDEEDNWTMVRYLPPKEESKKEPEK